MLHNNAISEALKHAIKDRDEQARRLDLYRNRALSLLAAVTIGGSFIAVVGRESDDGVNSWLGLGAMVAFLMQFGLTFYVLRPAKGTTFSFRPDWLYHKVVDDEIELAELERRLLRGAARGAAINDAIVRRIGKAYSWSQFAFLAAVLLSISAVAAGG